MADNGPPPAPQDETNIFEETDMGWVWRGSDLNAILEQKPTANLAIFSVADSFIKIYPDYKSRFQKAYWSSIDKDINGSFHCNYDYNKRVTPKVSWSCYKLKKVKSADDYKWKQPSLHIQWDHETGRQLVYIFDFLPSDKHGEFLDELPSLEERKHNPFSWHAAFASVILEQYDEAFWMIRDLVRSHEKERRHSVDDKTFFPRLHDIARHVFHYNETVEVAEHTLQRLVREQLRWRKEDGGNIKEHVSFWLNPHQELLFQEKAAHSLKTRSKSLNDRHLNEINLGFNLVSQGFGHDARSDSTMMRTLAVVSMVYLPGTFVSGLFGTNFFDFQASIPDTWTSSPKFWLYWAVTVPLTLGTMVVWALWHWWPWGPRLRKVWVSTKQILDPRNQTGDVKNTGATQRTGTELSMRLLRARTTMTRRNVHRQETV